MFYKKYFFGDTAVCYQEVPVEGHEGKTTVGLALFPVGEEKEVPMDSLIQVSFTGDETLIDYTLGVTMRNREGTLLKVEEQAAEENAVVTRLRDARGNVYLHHLEYSPKTGVFTVWAEYCNLTGKEQTLESLQSFSISGIHALRGGKATLAGLRLHRLTSAWSRECRPEEDSFSNLGLDTSWARYGVKCERFGEVGSMSNRGHFPFAAVEDKERHIVWAAMMEAPSSWQMEVYAEKETCALSGGLADYEFGHWRKNIAPGESFATHKAFLTVKSSVLACCNAFVAEQEQRLKVPASEESMPVLFNEYCTTWGCPSAENINAILKAIEPFPIDTFVIDCGWYKPDDKGWCNAIGDWRESRALFPEGISAVSDAIRAAGKHPGIWFEFEVAGRDSDCFYDESKLLKRDGRIITGKNRRFLDLRLPKVQEYLKERMLDFLQKNGFEYIKIDYNDSLGIGCDSADGAAAGEGGRRIAEESLVWLAKLKEAVEGLVIENCSSGGSRIEPLRMSQVSMCSFSDAHECNEIPLVAANVSRVIPARQMQIWAVLREGESASRTIYSLCAAMMGRICLSGDVLHLDGERVRLIQEGLEFYQEVKDIVRYGKISLIDNTVEYYRAPEGRQVYLKEYEGRKLVIVHFLESAEKVSLPLDGYCLKRAFTDLAYTAEGELCIEGRPFSAGAFLLERI